MMKGFGSSLDRSDKVVAAVKQVADAIGHSMAQVALAWLNHRPTPVIPVLGARKLDQMKDNLASLDLKLAPEHVKSLDEASAIDLGFPHTFYERPSVRAIMHGGLRDKILA